MSAKSPVDDADVIELWEIITEGTVWVWTKDVRRPGYMEKTRVGGRAGGSKRLRLTRDERRYNEEQIIDEMAMSNPFRNGALKLMKSRTNEELPEDIDTTYQLDNEDLAELLKIRDEELFKSEVDGIASELIVRRLYMLAEKAGTAAQLEAIRGVVDSRYRAGGTQRTVAELLAGDASLGTVLS